MGMKDILELQIFNLKQEIESNNGRLRSRCDKRSV